MQWLRLYDDVLDDPKVQRLPPHLFKHWINLLCLANKGVPRGTLPNIADVGFRLRLTEDQAADVLSELVIRGLLVVEGGWTRPHNWDERQFKSDDVNARVKAHRERNVTPENRETLHATLHVTPPDTDTDTDTEQNRAETTVPAAPAVKAKPRKRISDAWTLTDELRAYAVEHGIPAAQVDEFAAEFKRYWQGDGRPKADWDLTFMGRVRDQAGRYQARASPNGSNGQHPEQRRPSVPRFETIAHRYEKGGGG